MLSSSDITFSIPTPTVGETITITANVKNKGTAQADNVVVQFYDGDPSAGGILIGQTTIASISSFGSSQSTITYAIPTATGGNLHNASVLQELKKIPICDLKYGIIFCMKQ
ncbi:MAG: CARDB domain-containing protein [Thermodesulfovibrionales bacterium]